MTNEIKIEKNKENKESKFMTFGLTVIILIILLVFGRFFPQLGAVSLILITIFLMILLILLTVNDLFYVTFLEGYTTRAKAAFGLFWLSAWLLNRVFSSSLENWHFLGLSSSSAYDPYGTSTWRFALEIMLNGLTLDIFDHFNIHMTELKPERLFSLYWFYCYLYKIFWSSYGIALANLIYHLRKKSNRKTL